MCLKTEVYQACSRRFKRIQRHGVSFVSLLATDSIPLLSYRILSQSLGFSSLGSKHLLWKVALTRCRIKKIFARVCYPTYVFHCCYKGYRPRHVMLSSIGEFIQSPPVSPDTLLCYYVADPTTVLYVKVLGRR